MRLIDADELDKERIDYIVSGYANSPEDCAEFGMMIIKAPTICDIDAIRCDIYEQFMTFDGRIHDVSARKCLEIIGKHTKGDSK